MAVDLSQIMQERAEAKVPVGGAELVLGFNLAAFSPAFITELPKLALDEALHRLVLDWDIERGGKPYPLTKANLAKLPVLLKRRMLNAIWESTFPNASSADA